MDSWSAHTPSPSLKFENSPTESLLSTPDEMYPSLFGTAPAPAPAPQTLNPLEMMSPRSIVDDTDLSLLSAMTPAPQTPAADGSTPEKKPVKKRKSWGQVLPEPKTNLPPRKRAKTEDEKEQRRVERVLRNRRAAQSSRERKRQEVEALENRNKQLEELLRKTQQDNATLLAELRKFTSVSGVMTGASTSFDALRPSPVTFSQELFSSQDGHNLSAPTTGALELLTTIPTNNTVNPASISPVLTPVAEEADEDSEPAAVAPLTGASLAANASTDATQHPAAMLCSDLQCRSAEAAPSWLVAQQPLHPALALLLPLQLLLTSTSTILMHCRRPLMQIAMSLKASFSLPPTPAILNTIILLVTNPSPSRTTSTSTTSSQTTTSHPPTSSNRSTNSTVARSQSRRSSTLRLKFLRKILTCSPALARPLMDATAEALRLVSGNGYEVDRVSSDDASAAAAAGDLAKQLKQVGGGTHWLNGARVPSKEVLITLMWVLQAEERKLQIRQGLTTSKLGSPSILKTAPTTTERERFVLKVLPKRSLDGVPENVSLKRRRVD